MTVLGKNKINFYTLRETYQIDGGLRFNPVKYLNHYYHIQNVKKGVSDYEFLGL